jgi:hypothetical protein
MHYALLSRQSVALLPAAASTEKPNNQDSVKIR